MNRHAARTLAALVFALWVSASAKAEQFAASMAETKLDTGTPTNTARGHLAVADSKVRLEVPDFPDGFFLSDSASGVAYFIRPREHVFMEARQSSRLAQILIPVDSQSACEQWQKPAPAAAVEATASVWRCRRVGDEVIQDRVTVRYALTATDGRAFEVWVDRALKFPVRVDADIGVVIEVTDIREGPQPDVAFEIPADFRKFDPQGLIDRIKQSDVWVDDPPAK